MTGRIVACALVALASGGCWLQPGQGPGHTRSNPYESALTEANVASLAPAWSVDLGASSASEALVSGGRAYLRRNGPDSPGVRAIDAATGATAWDRPLGTDLPGWSGPAFSGDNLWLTAIDTSLPGCPSRLVELGPANGDVVSSEPANISLSPLVTSGPVAAFTATTACAPQGPGELVVRDVDSHEVRWRYEFPGLPGTPAMAGGLVFVTADGTLYAFDADGCGAATCEPAWTTAGGGTGDLVADGGRVFTVSHDTQRWPDGQTSATSTLRVHAAATGELLWATTYSGDNGPVTPPSGRIGSVATAGDTVYVSGARGTADSLDAYPAAGCGQATCSPSWSGSLDDRAGTLAVGGGVAYVGHGGTLGGEGDVSAFSADGCGATSCAALTTVAVPAAPQSLSLAGGRLFAVSTSGSAASLTAYAAA